nr:YgdI/YgdR family lipoprotein [uncultured Pseudomonas sp.]
MPACLAGTFICAVLSGCSTPSSIILNDGREIQTRDIPNYNGRTGFYEFRQIDGKLTRINKTSVLTIKDL